MRKTWLTKLSTASLSIAVSACAIKPPDIFACKKLDPVVTKAGDVLPSPTCVEKIGENSCGRCTYTITDEVFFVGNQPANHYKGRSWDQLVDHSVILPAKESYAPLKSYIINSCKASSCDAAISDWRFRLEQLD